MNITYTHKFQDYTAKELGAKQNLKHMMLLFWWDNIPQEVRVMRQPFRDDAEEAIEEWIDERSPIDIHPISISDFLSQLVTDTIAIWKDNTNA